MSRSNYNWIQLMNHTQRLIIMAITSSLILKPLGLTIFYWKLKKKREHDKSK